MNQEQSVEIFISYSQRDKQFASELRKHLSGLQRQYPSIKIWDAANIVPGTELKSAIREHLMSAQVILFLVSPDLLASSEAFDEQRQIAARQKLEAVSVIPVLLRSTELRQTFLANLELLPANGKPLSAWKSQDLAYLEIIDAVRAAIASLRSPAKVDNEKKRLRKILETFSERELLTLSLDLRLGISALQDDTSGSRKVGFPKISVDRLLQYMEQHGRIEELADYIRQNCPVSNENKEAI